MLILTSPGDHLLVQFRSLPAYVAPCPQHGLDDFRKLRVVLQKIPDMPLENAARALLTRVLINMRSNPLTRTVL